MKIGSTCTGTGALDEAVKRVFPHSEVVWHCEFDPNASKILEHHYPGIPNHGDLTGVDWTTVEPIDILTTGFPCQDVSVAGKREGLRDGTRTGVWLNIVHAIDTLKPTYVVIENVRGLLSAPAVISDVEPGSESLGNRADRPSLRAIGAVLGTLSELGYDAEWTNLRASDIGAPHRRDRIFILAHRTVPDARGDRLERCTEPNLGTQRP